MIQLCECIFSCWSRRQEMGTLCSHIYTEGQQWFSVGTNRPKVCQEIILHNITALCLYTAGWIHAFILFITVSDSAIQRLQQKLRLIIPANIFDQSSVGQFCWATVCCYRLIRVAFGVVFCCYSTRCFIPFFTEFVPPKDTTARRLGGSTSGRQYFLHFIAPIIVLISPEADFLSLSLIMSHCDRLSVHVSALCLHCAAEQHQARCTSGM